MTSPSPAKTAGRRPLLVVLAVAAAAVAAVVLFVLVLLPPLRRSARLNALTEHVDVNHKALVESDDPDLNEALVTRMKDESRPFRNRVGAAAVLLKRDRFAPVDAALRNGSLDLRTVALSALRRHPAFTKQIAPDPGARVKETVVEWLGREGDPTRKQALEIVMSLRPPEALPSIRAIAASSAERPDVRRTAIGALQIYTDCEAVPMLHRVALSDPDPGVRLGAVQALDVLHRYRGAPCAAVLTTEMVREAVAAALAHPGEGDADRILRTGAIGLMKRRPELAEGQLDTLRARFTAATAVSERGDALEALVHLGDEKTTADLPRWFHDPEDGVRHSAVRALAELTDAARFRPLAALLVGYVRDETKPSGESTYSAALHRLRNDAGSWVGFPPRPPSPPTQRSAERELIKQLYAKGEAEGVTRASVADAWYRHLAGQAGLDAAGVEAAVAARDAFWAKARSGDAAGARALLDADPTAKAHPELFLYERGWLAVRG